MEDVQFFKPVSFVTLVQQFKVGWVYKNISCMLVTYCDSPLHWLSIEFHCFSGRCPIFLSRFIRYTCFSCFRQIESTKIHKKMLVTCCYSQLHWFSIHFLSFSCFKGRCPFFFSLVSFVTLVSADCVYKKSL